ncbi:MAG: SlyX family protein [Cellvibrionaceae bacterium]|nr:SlyX family protein [Cellvibrionaceae bacterium]
MTNSTDSQAALAEQIVDLQSRLLFQEDALQEMSAQMALQAQELQVARQHIQLLNQKLTDLFFNSNSAARLRPTSGRRTIESASGAAQLCLPKKNICMAGWPI